MAIVSENVDIEHRYRLRSCTNCTFWSSCVMGEKRRNNCTCDFAKHGCYSYRGKYLTEKLMNSKDRRQYLYANKSQQKPTKTN